MSPTRTKSRRSCTTTVFPPHSSNTWTPLSSPSSQNLHSRCSRGTGFLACERRRRCSTARQCSPSETRVNAFRSRAFSTRRYETRRTNVTSESKRSTEECALDVLQLVTQTGVDVERHGQISSLRSGRSKCARKLLTGKCEAPKQDQTCGARPSTTSST